MPKIPGTYTYECGLCRIRLIFPCRIYDHEKIIRLYRWIPVQRIWHCPCCATYAEKLDKDGWKWIELDECDNCIVHGDQSEGFWPQHYERGPYSGWHHPTCIARHNAQEQTFRRYEDNDDIICL